MLLSRLLTLFLLLVGTTLARAESLVLLTENLPPFNMAVSGGNFARDDGITGISTETTRLICERAGIECQQILRFPWERVYTQALNEAGYGLFSVARTAEREDLFKWVGPIAGEDWVLLARADSPIQLTSLDQAGQYRLGGYKGDAPSEKVVESGLQVQQSLYDKENPVRLAEGQIDLWVTSSVAGQYLARQQGHADFRVALTFGRGDLYLALNKQTPDATVDKLRTALEQLRGEGRLQAISQKY
ncbi:substrate-binding periplasmic protein [Pseudomonas paralcaligenes]|uniref:substrate-binding periplasmic protein n=1 Tax=Pseudomonas paralcaligenes TaxID=2772558 RepID=UPI001C826E92|nr:ABC transporter substrate-binding protein [Pseudomonas paralcaligenes]